MKMTTPLVVTKRKARYSYPWALYSIRARMKLSNIWPSCGDAPLTTLYSDLVWNEINVVGPDVCYFFQ